MRERKEWERFIPSYQNCKPISKVGACLLNNVMEQTFYCLLRRWSLLGMDIKYAKCYHHGIKMLYKGVSVDSIVVFDWNFWKWFHTVVTIHLQCDWRVSPLQFAKAFLLYSPPLWTLKSLKGWIGHPSRPSFSPHSPCDHDDYPCR